MLNVQGEKNKSMTGLKGNFLSSGLRPKCGFAELL